MQKKQKRFSSGHLLKFEGVGDRDVYNITVPFESGGETYIVGRVEPRDRILESEVIFFEKIGDTWQAINAPRYHLEDPFITKIGSELIFGGVEIVSAGTPVIFRTVFFRGTNPQALTQFAQGPMGMKDIRFLELSGHEIAVFTRPQGGAYGLGKIGVTKVNHLKDLEKLDYFSAKIISGQFTDETWGGSNELHLLKNGLIGVLGHIALRDTLGNRHYSAMVFTYDTVRGDVSSIKIIASRKDFPPAPAKTPDLEDVIFPGGLVRNPDGTATLYAGLSDAAAGYTVLPDPFLEYET